MPLPGGATDKFGNRYEGRWTVACMVEVMEEKANSIRLEPPGPEGDSSEFWLQKGHDREYHQVKRQRGASGRWTLAEMDEKNVLKSFWTKLQSETAVCVFVSTQAAYQLQELTERAGSAASWAEFEQHFLTGDNNRAFQELCSRWENSSAEAAFQGLRRVRVETVSEEFLRTVVESRLAALVEGDRSTVTEVLAQLALDRVHQELTTHDIWRHLENRGLKRRHWGKDPLVLARVDEQNRRYFGQLGERLINHQLIPRPEANDILATLTSSSSKPGILVAGTAGGGKSGILLQAGEALIQLGVPVLAFRVDRLSPTPLPDQVGRQDLGLPGSPAVVLATVAQGRNCVLIIDQLDAVSQASGRHPSFFDCVNEIIKQAQAYPNMRLLLACRKFDLDNDYRLRLLTDQNGVADVVPIQPLPVATVKDVVTALGLEADRLSNKQLNLLAVPLHLCLLAEVARSDGGDVLHFETVNDLYNRFWDAKWADTRQRLDRSPKWTQVVDALCDYMSSWQVLSAPTAEVDECLDDANAMASEHVLVRDGSKWAFFHEGFFDYAFARRFAGRGHEVLPFLLGGEQHLFRRAQVRQILAHEREANNDRYLADLKSLLLEPSVRFHIKQVVFDWLAQSTDPTIEEWVVLQGLLSGADVSLSREAWFVVERSVPWFLLRDALGLIEKWLASDDPIEVDRTVHLLSRVQRQFADRVAQVVEPFVGQAGDWPKRFLFLFQSSDLEAGRRFFCLFLRLLTEGFLDDARNPIASNGDFWSFLFRLARSKPAWACEAIAVYFNRRLELSLANGQPNPFDRGSGAIPRSQFAKDILMNSAQHAPRDFIRAVLPFMLRVMELASNPDEPVPRTDLVWAYRSSGERYSIDDVLLLAMENALGELSAHAPEEFRMLALKLRGAHFETIQFLLVRAYAANGAFLADDAVDYLCEQPSRLQPGYTGNSYWATRLLLEAITPHCSTDRLQRLEALIFHYYPDWERQARARKYRGNAQFVLLTGIAPDRRSHVVSQRLAELARKFGKAVATAPPRSVTGGFVGSPIPESAVRKMGDDEWLGAIRKYNHDTISWRDGDTVGGAHQLSGTLESQAKAEPERFVALLERLPDDVHPYYFSAILRGVIDAKVDIDALVRACLRCHSIPGHPVGESIARALSKYAQSPLPDQALDLLVWHATEHPDPDKELWRTDAGDEKVYYGGDIYTAAINSTRGPAAEGIAEVLFHDENRLQSLQPVLWRMVRDPSVAVRSCVAAVLIAVLRLDRDLAVALFKELCDTEDALLKTPYIERFLAYALPTHFGALSPTLDRMITCDTPEVQEVGARQVCLASVVSDAALPLVLRCLAGADVLRKGAAQVYAANLRFAGFRTTCEQALIQLFQDASQEVQEEAAACFRGFEGDQLGDYTRLIEAFVESSAFSAHHHELIHALEETSAQLPAVVSRVCERFLDLVGSDASDIRTGTALDAQTIVHLLIRVYSQAKDPVLQLVSLDLIDRMTEQRVYGLDEALELYDR
jgi:hypothetical protein